MAGVSVQLCQEQNPPFAFLLSPYSCQKKWWNSIHPRIQCLPHTCATMHCRECSYMHMQMKGEEVESVELNFWQFQSCFVLSFLPQCKQWQKLEQIQWDIDDLFCVYTRHLHYSQCPGIYNILYIPFSPSSTLQYNIVLPVAVQLICLPNQPQAETKLMYLHWAFCHAFYTHTAKCKYQTTIFAWVMQTRHSLKAGLPDFFPR